MPGDGQGMAPNPGASVGLPGEGDSRAPHQGRREHTSVATSDYMIRREPDLRSEGAGATCGWSGTALAQLNDLRRQGLGVEPTWLAVLQRIRHRGVEGYRYWCSGYLRDIRRLFGRELNSHLHDRRLTIAEIGWAARVEHAAFQDYMHYVRGSREEVACLTHLSSDAVIPARGGRVSSERPQGPLSAMWIDNATGEWNTVVSDAVERLVNERLRPVVAMKGRRTPVWTMAGRKTPKRPPFSVASFTGRPVEPSHGPDGRLAGARFGCRAGGADGKVCGRRVH